MFRIGNEYTRAEIHAAVGGSMQAYLPTVSGQVVAVCVTPKLNPRAPHVILCGQGPVIAATGAALAKQAESIPVFVKRGINRWEYQGTKRVVAAHTSGSTFMSLIAGSGRPSSDVSIVIEMA